MLRVVPVIDNRYSLDTTDRAGRSAVLLREVLSFDIRGSVTFQWNPGMSALLGAVVNEAVLADVEVARTGSALPVVHLAA